MTDFFAHQSLLIRGVHQLSPKEGRVAQRVMPVARVVGGLTLITVGFYLLKGACV